MKINFLPLLLLSIAFFAVSCGKDGATGPKGATGATGAQGPTGAVGATGADGQNGSVIYSGTTVPPSTVGNTGDFYIDLTTGILYGPKTVSGWGTGFSLKGATGAAGTAGSKIYNGDGVPAATIGIAGDYYLDKTNYLLYGPKTASGWGTPINLQGPAGNANVKTDTFSVGGSQWIWNSQYAYETSASSYTEYFTRYYTRANNTITQDALDNGLVLVYFTPSPVNNPNQWVPLPYQFDSASGYTYNYVYVTALGSVTLHYFFIRTNSTATLPTLSTYNDEVRKFKIVTITGQTGVFMLQHHINLNNYMEVSKVTGLWQQDKTF